MDSTKVNWHAAELLDGKASPVAAVTSADTKKALLDQGLFLREHKGWMQELDLVAIGGGDGCALRVDVVSS